jgi:hypothetical protein
LLCFPGALSIHVRCSPSLHSSLLPFLCFLSGISGGCLLGSRKLETQWSIGTGLQALEDHRWMLPINSSLVLINVFLQQASSKLMKRIHVICKGLQTLLCFSSCHIKINPEGCHFQFCFSSFLFIFPLALYQDILNQTEKRKGQGKVVWA